MIWMKLMFVLLYYIVGFVVVVISERVDRAIYGKNFIKEDSFIYGWYIMMWPFYLVICIWWALGWIITKLV